MADIGIACTILGIEVIDRICDLLGIRRVLGPHIERVGERIRRTEAQAVISPLIYGYLQSVAVGKEPRRAATNILEPRKLRAVWPRL